MTPTTPQSRRPPARLGVVVVNYGSHRLLAEHLADLSGVSDVVVVVVDNLHSEPEREAVSRLAGARGWDLVARPGNDGFGRGVNAGVARATDLGCTSFLVVNPDARVSLACLRELWTSAEADRGAVFAPALVTSSGDPYFRGCQVNLRTGRMRSHWSGDGGDAVWRDWLTGACLAFHRDAWTRVGGMDEDFFLYWEDVDFSLRCRAVGLSLVIRTDLVAVHDEGGTQERHGNAKSATYYFYNCRNRLLFATRHLSRTRQLRWMATTPRESWAILLRGGRRQLVHSSQPLRATVRGSVDGIGLGLRAVLRPG